MPSISIILLAGLPGSGKSTYILNNFGVRENTLVFDDMSKMTQDLNKSAKQLLLEQIIPLLDKNIGEISVVISDVHFCNNEVLQKAKTMLDMLFKDLNLIPTISVISFENSKQQCVQNVITRIDQGDDRQVFNLIEFLSKNYKPSGLVIPVYTPNKHD